MDLNTREVIRAINNVAKGGGGGGNNDNNNNSSLEINCFTISDEPCGFVVGKIDNDSLMLDEDGIYTINQLLAFNSEQLHDIFDGPLDSYPEGFFIYKSIEDLNSRNYSIVEYGHFDNPNYQGIVFQNFLPDGISIKYCQVQLNGEEYYILSYYGDMNIQTYHSGQGR